MHNAQCIMHKRGDDIKKTILLTGLTGFIGKRVAESLLADYDITAIIRPDTDPCRYSEFADQIKIVFLDLAEQSGLETYLKKVSFDYIIHFAALRGGRDASEKVYYDTNVKATELFINCAVRTKSIFIFCSSVGVYGAIPQELPATIFTPQIPDNLYHATKIKCEMMILNQIATGGLKAYVIRPSITYGKGDFGFPFTLTRLVSQGLMVLPNEQIVVHLTNVETIAELVSKMCKEKFTDSDIYLVADTEPVVFRDLVNFIYHQLTGKQEYPKIKTLPKCCFSSGEIGAKKVLHSELWTSRFQLISNSWYYDVTSTYKGYKLKQYHTIPDFQVVTDWYKDITKK